MDIILITAVLCLALVAAFEFINGFHDTANAVAPVIYTNSLTPRKAVLLAAFFNFIWVILGGIGVAMGIIHLLPLDMMANQPGIGFGLCVVLALLFAAIIWNFGTWYLGIPASSSHTLIGSILGVSLAMYMIDDSVQLPLKKVTEVFESLLVSPVVGFMLAFWAMHLLHLFVVSKDFFKHPGRWWNRTPKPWIKYGLISTSAFVSFAHGSNDGQKWVGLAMLILISLLPASFAINPAANYKDINASVSSLEESIINLGHEDLDPKVKASIEHIQREARALRDGVNKEELTAKDKVDLRKHVLTIQKEAKAVGEEDKKIRNLIAHDVEMISSVTDYAPWWIIAMISISLGLGTMIGWKRIVITIGEKIGKDKLTYAQGTVAALMTAITISAASHLHLPVSTTHILSSGVAGTMAHEHGKDWLQGDTIRSILMAWVLTLPVTTILAGAIFLILRFLFVA
jgi:phosphate/sulfate permease